VTTCGVLRFGRHCSVVGGGAESVPGTGGMLFVLGVPCSGAGAASSPGTGTIPFSDGDSYGLRALDEPQPQPVAEGISGALQPGAAIGAAQPAGALQVAGAPQSQLAGAAHPGAPWLPQSHVLHLLRWLSNHFLRENLWLQLPGKPPPQRSLAPPHRCKLQHPTLVTTTRLAISENSNFIIRPFGVATIERGASGRNSTAVGYR
jgi:hypothetical protein